MNKIMRLLSSGRALYLNAIPGLVDYPPNVLLRLELKANLRKIRAKCRRRLSQDLNLPKKKRSRKYKFNLN